MKLGIVITTYNRPEYLQQCFDSLKAAELPDGTELLIIDDASEDKKTINIIKGLSVNGCIITTFFKEKKASVSNSLHIGYRELFARKCDVVINLDSDAIVRNDFIDVLLNLHLRFPNQIVTGFNCRTKNKDGSERHKITGTGINYNIKKSVGGINMVVNNTAYKKYILTALNAAINKGLNWDHQACINSEKDGKGIICAVPSVIQHIGIKSSMGHTSTEEPDTAEDFKPLHLPDVTLIGIDCVSIERLISAAEASAKDIVFGDIKLLTSLSSRHKNIVRIQPVKSKEQYSKFIIKELGNYVDTKYALIIQYDGYVLNYKSWRKEFFDYDYIGAPWWYRDNKNVGNGGFSLRSKKLLDALRDDDIIEMFHPEDHHICRTYRDYLESRYKIKYAPEKVASQFSIEGYNGDRKYSDQFGFHGNHVIRPIVKSKDEMPGLVISQFQGLGDILFCMPLINEWIKQGFKIIWPVIPAYVPIKKHFPDIIFLDMSLLEIDHTKKYEYEVGGLKVIPLRWADHIVKTHYRNVMRAKYDMYGMDFRKWRELKWKRDHDSENKLFSLLGIEEGEKYNLVNYNFRSDQSGRVRIRPENKYPVIEMRNIEGFTMLDWSKVIEKAAEIHTPGTAINYMLEVLDTKAEMHLYVRKPDEKDFSYYDYLLEKKYQFHF